MNVDAYAFPTHIRDDVSNNADGYSFATEPDNGIDTDTFCRELLATGKYAVLDSAGHVHWDAHRTAAWLDEYRRFETLQCLLTVMTGGMPPRGTEILEALMMNDGDSRPRSYYVHREEILLVLRYNKTSSRLGGTATDPARPAQS